jgi:hypothetical protein
LFVLFFLFGRQLVAYAADLALQWRAPEPVH